MGAGFSREALWSPCLCFLFFFFIRVSLVVVQELYSSHIEQAVASLLPQQMP